MPLHDRHYMRPDYESRRVPFNLWMPATYIVMILLVVAFALQQIDIAYGGFPYQVYFSLSAEGLRHGYVWQLITFQFLHVNLTHLFFNLIGLWCFGRFVEERLGRRHFIAVYLLSGVAGGLLQSMLGWIFPFPYGIPTLGASAGICGLLAVFALMEPEASILVFFILPIRAKYLLYISTVVALFFTIVPTDPGVAHAAHLGGLIFGAAYLRKGIGIIHHLAGWNPFSRSNRREKAIRSVKAQPSNAWQSEPEETPELPSGEFISQEVDPILEKISAHGIQSLTARERKILQAARARMSKR